MMKTKEDALKIRGWREQGTWRYVARKAAKYWPTKGYMSRNQIEGMDLCYKAAKILGENPQNKPWK